MTLSGKTKLTIKLIFYIGAILVLIVSSFLSIYLSLEPGPVSTNTSNTVVDIIDPGKIDEIEIKDINIENTSYNLSLKNTIEIKYNLIPEDTTQKVLVVRSDNNLISMPQKEYTEGSIIIEGFSVGEAKINISSYNNPNISKEITINVFENMLNSFTLNSGNPLSIPLESSKNLVINYNPIDCSYKGTNLFDFNSSNTSIATVNTSGRVTGVSIGECEINAYLKENRSIHSSIKVIITEKPSTPPGAMALSSFILNPDVEAGIIDNEISIYIGSSLNLATHISLTPSNTYQKSYSIYSSDENIVGIEDKSVFGNSLGTTTISIISSDNGSIKLDIVVNVLAVGIGDINLLTKSIILGDRVEIKYELLPLISSLTITDPSVIIESLTPELLVIENNSIAYALKKGVAQIKISDASNPDTYIIQDIDITPQNIGLYQRISNLIRKGLGHFLLFFVIGVSATLSFIFISRSKNYYLPIIMGLMYGFIFSVLSEYAQTQTPGRSGNVNDVMLDFRGSIVGVLLVGFIYYLIYIINYLKSKKKNLTP